MATIELGAFAEWDVLGAYVPQEVVLEAGARWDVLGAPQEVVLAASAMWHVRTMTTLAATAEWNVTTANPVVLATTSEWDAKHLTTLAATAGWDIERRPTDVDPIAQLNGITLDVVEFDTGGYSLNFELIEHYDDSILMHNVRKGLGERRPRIRVTGTTAADLDAKEAAIRAACIAGGAFVWQSRDKNGTLGAVQTDSVAPSDEPSFAKDQEREALFQSYATLVLRIWPP
jgi:hypothetical protein